MKTTHYFRGAARRWSSRLAGFAAALCASSLLGQQPEAVKLPRSPEFESCKTNLSRIFDAIQEYRKVHDAWPELLSDLHPEYISDLTRFLCPEKMAHGGPRPVPPYLRPGPFEDLIPTDYAYEFKAKPYPLWAGFTPTEREYKLRQMKIVGSNVPIVRCMNHGPAPNLFLSVGGNIFEQTGTDWECLFTNAQITLEHLLPAAIFFDFAPQPGRFTDGIRPRDPATDPNLIDLNRHYTSALSTPWLWRNNGIDLSSISRGTVQLTNPPVPFDVRGVIQLTSLNMLSPFSVRASNIVVGQKGRFLHFLEGAVQGEPFGKKRPADTRGTPIGRYEVRYIDGQSRQIPIRYGQDVLVCDAGDDSIPSDAKVAWQRTNGSTRICLYHQRWPNPRPDTEIASLDFVSNMAKAAPFLIAVTLEP